MKLNIDLLKAVTSGAESVEYRNGMYCFNRFNEEELRYYSATSFIKKAYATAGVEMNFKTDAKALTLSGVVREGSSRTYYTFDILVNSEHIGEIKNFDMSQMIPDYVGKVFDRGEFFGTFELGEGMKNVRIVFPWSSAAYLSEIELYEATVIKPVKRHKNMLIYGDSITQGYDAESSFRSYASMLAESLDANAYNKAIGGEIFQPALSAIKNNIEPDYITVAYGTNDWFHSTGREDFVDRASRFYKNLSFNYPKSKIFAISPIWRADIEGRVSNVGDFFEIGRIIKSIADSLENVIFIDGYDFVPHNSDYYADLRLHPRDSGFDYYAKNLAAKIKEYI